MVKIQENNLSKKVDSWMNIVKKMNNKKIVVISPSLNGGGAEKVAVNLANYYASIGHEVDLVLFKKVGKYIDLVNSDVDLINLNVSFFKLKDNYILSVIRDANIMVGLASYGLNIKHLVFREANTLDSVRSMKFIYSV
ncbi:MAG: hypothetical protein ACQERD_10660 [Campylobacterota bacterium]